MKTIFLFLFTAISIFMSKAETKISVAPNSGMISSPITLSDQWNPVSNYYEGGIYCMEVFENEIYAGGSFLDMDGIPGADYLARWNGCEWQSVTSSINGMVNVIVPNGNSLYMAGSFTGLVGKLTNNTWTTFPGLPDAPYDIAVNTNGIYVAIYSEPSGDPIVTIYKLNGNTWVQQGPPITLLYAVAPNLEAYGTSVYLGGNFNDAGGNANADNIAKWNGSTWEGLGSGLNGTVYQIVAVGNDVYACGGFTDAGGNPNADKIARWDGSNWNNVGTGFNLWDHLTAMRITDDYIYVYATDWNECYDYFRRYNFQTSSWDVYPDYSIWGCAENYAILEFDDNLYTANTIDLERWGEPGPYIEITGVPSSLCQDAAPIALPTTQSGYTGTWSGPGVSNNVFNPAGQYSYVGLLFTPNPGQCVSAIGYEIDVYLHYLEYDYSPTFCESAPPIPLSQFQYGVPGTWSGTGVSNNFFDPSGLLGGYELTFTPNAGQCYAIATLYVIVQLTAIPNIFGVPASICENANAIALPVIQSGIEGNWSGQGVINNTFNPSGLNGIITLTFTPDPEFCATENTFDIQVNPEIIITINGVPDSLCQISPSIPLPTTQSGIYGYWSGPGVTNNYFNPANQNGNTVITFHPTAGQCADLTTTSISVFLNTILISGIPNSVCESVPPIQLPTLQSGFTGNWSGQGVNNNIFNPLGLFGNIQLTFTPLPGECASVATQSILVDSLLVPILVELPNSVCSLDDPILLSVIQGNITGNWSGPGVNNNVFDPTELSGDILLDFIPNPGQCATTASTFISVQNALPPEITGLPEWMCVLAPPTALPVIFQNITGNWSGPGISNNTFNPNGLDGNINLVFAPNAGQCAVEASATITVYTSFTPAITGVPLSICEMAIPQNLPASQNGVVGNWSGPGVVNNVFNPSGQSDTVQLVFTPLPMQCATNANWNIAIDIPVALQIVDVPTSICETDLPITLSLIESGITGTWTGTGIVNDTFNPIGLYGLQELIFNPNPGQCGLTGSTDILVNGHVYPELMELPDSICQNDHPIALSIVQDSIEGTWIGNGIQHNIFFPDSLSGGQLLSFVANNGACEDTSNTEIFINALPAVTNVQVTCDSMANTYQVSFDIVGGDPSSYSIDDVLLGGTSFTSSPIPFTQVNYSFLLDDVVGCGPVTISGFNTCLCATYSGTMNFNGAPLRLCVGPKFIVISNGDAQLDPDDVISYVLHDHAGTSLGSVYSINDQGVFNFLPGMIIGQTYFISVVAGTNNGFGGVNLNDPCLSVSAGIPIVFEVCDPKKDRNDPVLPNIDDPFSQPGGDHTADDSIETKGKDIRPALPSDSFQPDNISIEWNDPELTISNLVIYDLLGRVVFNRKNVKGDELILLQEQIMDGKILIPGWYVMFIQAKGVDGNTIYLHKEWFSAGR